MMSIRRSESTRRMKRRTRSRRRRRKRRRRRRRCPNGLVAIYFPNNACIHGFLLVF